MLALTQCSTEAHLAGQCDDDDDVTVSEVRGSPKTLGFIDCISEMSNTNVKNIPLSK